VGKESRGAFAAVARVAEPGSALLAKASPARARVGGAALSERRAGARRAGAAAPLQLQRSRVQHRLRESHWLFSLSKLPSSSFHEATHDVFRNRRLRLAVGGRLFCFRAAEGERFGAFRVDERRGGGVACFPSIFS